MSDDQPPKSPAPKSLPEWLGLTDTPNWRVARPLGIVVSVLATVFVVLALVAAFMALARSIAGGGGAMAGLGASGLIVAILGAPFLIWTTVLKHRTVGFQKEGHLTDRISKAVEQLGAEKTVKTVVEGGLSVEETKPNIEVRIGAILSLERIAQDSCAYDKGRDHVRVMEILCAYVRENAPASGAKTSLRQNWDRESDRWGGDPDDFEVWFCKKHGIHERTFEDALSIEALQLWANTLPKPRQDIALVLRVIGRRDAIQRRAEARWGNEVGSKDEWSFDFPCPKLPDRIGSEPLKPGALQTYLDALALWKAKIGRYRGYRLNLRETNLQNCDLSKLCLSGADLSGASLEGVDANQVMMIGADLSGSRLDCGNFSGATLQAVNLFSAFMEDADFSGSKMEGATLENGRLERVFFSKASLAGSNLAQASLQSSFFQGAGLEGVDLRVANMHNSDFRQSRMEGVDIWAANLQGAKLQAVDMSLVKNLATDRVVTAFGDASTVLPGGKGPGSAEWPAHWPKAKLDYNTYQTELAKFRASPSTYAPPSP
jgi:uncharacterized protein YjbI with pentapeptide repeats